MTLLLPFSATRDGVAGEATGRPPGRMRPRIFSSGCRRVGQDALVPVDDGFEPPRQRAADLRDQADAIEAERDAHRGGPLPHRQVDLPALRKDPAPGLADLPAEEFEGVAEAADARASARLERLVIAVEPHRPGAPRKEFVARMGR